LPKRERIPSMLDLTIRRSASACGCVDQGTDGRSQTAAASSESCIVRLVRVIESTTVLAARRSLFICQP
jgi:hypothetical protein